MILARYKPKENHRSSKTPTTRAHVSSAIKEGMFHPGMKVERDTLEARRVGRLTDPLNPLEERIEDTKCRDSFSQH